MRKERHARWMLLTLVLLAAAVSAVAWRERSRVQVVHARMPENGGWSPENLIAQTGQPLRLRLTSDDVVHGFAIGQSDQPAVDIHPGETTEVTLTFDRPGKYTFYCTRWCGANHWRMRGVIEVRGPGEEPETPESPLYVRLGLDIDAEHHTETLPVEKPSASRGASLVSAYSLSTAIAPFADQEYYLSHSPEQTWHDLRLNPALAPLSDQGVWDVVAYLWGLNATLQRREAGQSLYAANCAACHGEGGAGDGVYADDLAISGIQAMEAGHEPSGEHAATTPADFTDAGHMLSASPAHLQGKIIRGGMGTGMPYWGPIFTAEQTWALVAYLWNFVFEMEIQP